MFLPLLLVGGCTSPEDAASEIALQFATLPLDDAASRHMLACADDQAAKSEAQLRQELLEVTANPFAALALNAAREQLGGPRTVTSVVLDAEQTNASVGLVAVSGKEGDGEVALPLTLRLRREGDRWYVRTGWAEEKRRQEVTAEVNGKVEAADAAVMDFQIDVAAAALDAAAAAVAKLEATDPEHAPLSERVEGRRTQLADFRKMWIAGRWTWSEEVDAMSDDRNVFVRLRAVGTLRNAIDAPKPVTLMFRCRRNRLDVFVVTESMLDADWRYDAVYGQQRWGTAPAQRFSGSVSTDREAVFLRDPRSWIRAFEEHEADGWTVELPVYNRVPQAVRFDLTGAKQALARLPSVCR